MISSGALRANGGGGGEGSCRCQVGLDGQDGSDGSSTPSVPPAEGGASATDDQSCNCGATSVSPSGGDGGDGSFGKFGNPRDGSNGDLGEGGGGGGGSDGLLLLEADSFPTYAESAIDPWPSDVCGVLLDPAEQPGSRPCS